MVAGIQETMDLQNKYLGPINSRLQGWESEFGEQTENYYLDIVESLDSMTGQAFIDKSKMLQNIASLVGQGIAYNVEERALITTLGDKLVTTFEANNEDLLRLIRLQQQDLTVSQLGSEAQLTQFFNENFSDTSYLNQAYDNVLSTISEAMSLMNSDDAVNFNYNVQK